MNDPPNRMGANRMIPSASRISWERVWQAVDRVRDRLLRVTRLLNESGIPYAVVGGNAVAAWVSSIDPAAQRFTQDVDLLVRRADLARVNEALKPGGFIYRRAASIDRFLDGSDAGVRDAVHLVFAEEKVREEYPAPSPRVDETEQTREFSVLALDALVRMKLTSFRLKDRVHIQDLIGVGLVDVQWPERFPPILADRLREILANPEG